MSSISLTLGLRGRLLSGTQTTLQGALFGNNEPGFTFEPWDITTLYQDRAGTTPVTAAGQSVGLRLSKDQGLRIGPELVTNGGFDTDTWWLKGGGCTISGGVGVATAAVNGSGFYRTAFLTIGSYYEITFTVVSVSAGGFRVGFFASAYSATRTAPGTYTVRLRADGTAFVVETVGTTTGTVDNVSVKEITGNHQVAVSDAKRGVYGWMPKTGKRNLLTYTEQFDNAVWAKFRSTVSANAAVAPDATTTAEKLIPNNGTTTGGAYNTTAITIASGSAHTASVYVKAAELGFVFVGANIRGSSTSVGLCVNLSTGARSNEGASGTYTVTSVGSGWWRITCSGTSSTTNGYLELWPLGAAGSFDSYTGNGTSGILIWGAQLEPGSTATAYQRVVSQYDITEAGVPTCYYVQADGVDDAYVTPTITPNTDKVQVFAGVRVSSGSTGVVLEHSASVSLNSGSFYLVTSNGAVNYFSFASKGTLVQDARTVTGPTPPANLLMTGLGDISGDRSTLRIDGVQVAQLMADQGTGNFLAYPAYIYSRGGTSIPFNGLDFGHAVRFGPNLDAATIARVEALIARNTPEVTL